MTAMANAKIDPNAILWMFPLDNPGKKERRREKEEKRGERD